MENSKDKKELKEELKDLKKKPFSPEILASINKKEKYVNKPINK